MDKGAKLVQGNEACAIGALAAGLEFFAGYPITPSTEIAELCARELPKMGGVFIQMEDEIASIAACIGASLAGKKAMTATSGPGFSLMQECLGYACLCEIPLVIIDAQRAGPSTGLPTSPAQGDFMQARWGSHGDRPLVVLAPGRVGECFELVFKAFDIAESYRVPVVVLTDEVIAHTRERVVLPDISKLRPERRRSPATPADYRPYAADPDSGVPPMASIGTGFRRHVTGLIHDEEGRPSSRPEVAEALLYRLTRKIEGAAGELEDIVSEGVQDAEVLVVAYGSSALSALSAVRRARREGIKAGLLRPRTLWPFPDAAVASAASRARRVVVPEMSLGQLAFVVERAVAGRVTVERLGKVSGELFHPDEIFSVLEAAR